MRLTLSCRPGNVGCFLLASLLAGCGGGGTAPVPDTTPPPPDPPPTAKPKVMQADSLRPVPRELLPIEQRHFVERTGFGFEPERLAELEAIGLEQMVERTVIFRWSPVEDRALRELPNAARPSEDDVLRYWLTLMVESDQPFRDQLALFWHDQFAVSDAKLDDSTRHLMLDHVRMLRGQSVGNLQRFYRSVLEDGATQIWLDGVDSTSRHRNENLAREFWELLSLGQGNGYTENDIRAAAWALTGFRLVEDPSKNNTYVTYDPKRGDRNIRRIFGEPRQYGPEELVAVTFEKRPVALHYVRRMFEWLCYPDPPKHIVDELVFTLVDSGWSQRAVLRQILTSEAFFSAKSRAQQRVKSPVEFLVGFIRSTGLKIPVDDMVYLLHEMRQVPTRPPSIGGWASGDDWITQETQVARANAIVAAVERTPYQQSGGAFDLTRMLPARRRDSTSVARHLVGLLGVDATADELEQFTEFLDSELDPVRYEPRPSRFEDIFDADVDEAEKRVRGLAFVLSQHPDYHIR